MRARPGIGAPVVGLAAARDVVRALATHGANLSGHRIRAMAERDVPAVDICALPRDRSRGFRDRKFDHIALMDGFQADAVQGIWDCTGLVGTEIGTKVSTT